MKLLKLAIWGAAVGLLAACGPSKDEIRRQQILECEIADSVFATKTEIDGHHLVIELGAPSRLDVEAVDPTLFNFFAAYQIKEIDITPLNLFVNALKQTGDTVEVVLRNGDQAKSFYLAPAKILLLHGAKNTDLDISGVKQGLKAAAESFFPLYPPDSAAQKSVSIDKGFLQFELTFSSAKSFERYDQSIFTAKYLPMLKSEFQKLNSGRLMLYTPLKSIGVEGVRMVYKAEDSQKTIKQAFPWRELIKTDNENTDKGKDK